MGVEAFTRAAEAWLDGEGIEETQPGLVEVTSLSTDIGTEFQRLLIAALSQPGDALGLYLTESIDLRAEFSAAYLAAIDGLQPLIESAEPTPLAAALNRESATLRAFLGSWEALEPPPAARGTHDLQVGSIELIADIFSEMAIPVAAEDTEATRQVGERMDVFVDEVAATNASWSQLVIDALKARD
jgi:hypothetical protein